MMSVLIKGLIMPSCCDGCTFSDWSNLHQTASCKLHDYDPCFSDHSMEYTDKRADFCLLVEIPVPHGDLIDRDAPEIVFCKDCRKHNVKVGFDENFHTVWKEDACPLVDWRGKAKEHEFDYQYCAFAERRTE